MGIVFSMGFDKYMVTSNLYYSIIQKNIYHSKSISAFYQFLHPKPHTLPSTNLFVASMAFLSKISHSKDHSVVSIFRLEFFTL